MRLVVGARGAGSKTLVPDGAEKAIGLPPGSGRFGQHNRRVREVIALALSGCHSDTLMFKRECDRSQ